MGDVTARRQVVLHKTARLEGDVKTPSLVMEEGAILNGAVVMQRPEAGNGKAEKQASGGKSGNGNGNAGGDAAK